MKDYDFLFEFTEFSENEGEQILYEGKTIEDAWNCLINKHGFSRKELKFICKLSVFEGEMLGYDTY